MTAIISNPDFSNEIFKALKMVNEEIVYKKIDREIDIISEVQKISAYPVKQLILDISCVEDCKRVPQAIRKLLMINDTIRIFIIAPDKFSGNEVISTLISMGIYDIIGQRNSEEMSIVTSLVEHFEKPGTYSKAVKWDEGVKTRKDEFINTETGRFGVKNKEKSGALTIEKDKIIGTVVIAVAGTMHRIGTTHTTISIAKYLLENKHGVAVVELHDSNNFSYIRNSYENVEKKNEMFSLAGIDFYPFSPYLSVSDLLQEGYSYIVLDMGVYNECNITEFKRAHDRIIVSGVKDWELEELELLLDTEDGTLKSKYYFTFSDDAMFEFVESSMETLSCFKAPYNPQPFHLNADCEKVFGNMLKNILPQIIDKEENLGFIGSILKKNEVTLYHKPILLEKFRINYMGINESQVGSSTFFRKYESLFKFAFLFVVITSLMIGLYHAFFSKYINLAEINLFRNK